MNTGAIIFIVILVIPIWFWVVYSVIRSAVKSAMNEVLTRELLSMKAYQVAALKKQGLSSEEIEEAKRYLQKRRKYIERGRSNELVKLEGYWENRI